jgi:hypothetical protein
MAMNAGLVTVTRPPEQERTTPECARPAHPMYGLFLWTSNISPNAHPTEYPFSSAVEQPGRPLADGGSKLVLLKPNHDHSEYFAQTELNTIWFGCTSCILKRRNILP